MMDNCGQVEPKLQVKINSRLAKSLRLRSHPGTTGNFDVVVEDPWLGAFTLHSQFDLLVKQEGSDWRPLKLDELCRILAARSDVPDIDDETINPRPPDPMPPNEPNEFTGARPKLVRLGTIVGLDACVQRIETILYRASIPHLRAGAIFVVPSMLNARECLLRAGFYQDRKYESVLFDPESQIAIRLLERDPRTLLG